MRTYFLSLADTMKGVGGFTTTRFRVPVLHTKMRTRYRSTPGTYHVPTAIVIMELDAEIGNGRKKRNSKGKKNIPLVVSAQ